MVYVVMTLALAASESRTAQYDSPTPTTFPPDLAFADFTWVPGNGRAHENPLSTDLFTVELRIDAAYNYEFSRPIDDTITGSSSVFRHGEIQLTELGAGGEFHNGKVMARFMTQFGEYSQGSTRNDPSPARGQWHLDNAYRYLSEAYAGYHFDLLGGVNLQAGIFMSFIGLWSYYNADNWTYQPSYVSSNTPFFFNGARMQIFVSDRLKFEPWLINGWQAYGRLNEAPGIGGQVTWRPSGSVVFMANQYVGADTLGIPKRKRVHSDNSLIVKYYDNPDAFFNRMAFTLTVDAGCEFGGSVRCNKQNFLGFMAYNRFWMADGLFAFTVGGGAISNPGRYLVLLPPINGSTAASGTPYFTENPGDKFTAWDTQVAFDFMPSDFVDWRLEYNHRYANVPYFAGTGGITPPGGNQGAPGSQVAGWSPDLVKTENRLTLAFLVKI